jgi:hypothetical protein
LEPIDCREQASTEPAQSDLKLLTGLASQQSKGATDMEPHFVITVLFVLLTTVLT